MEKDKIELKTIMETAEVADYLTALAKGFRAGRIVVEKDGEHLVLSPAAMSKAEVEIEARIKKDKAKFSLELSWLLAPEQDECVEFKIGTELPKPALTHEERCGDKKPEAKKSEDKAPGDKNPAPHFAKADAKAVVKPADKPAPIQAKSDVKPATAPAVHEPGGKAVVATPAQAKPKA
ncbi:MAG: amphi-Trp domain-containing protein [Proteobacteria bacterium]|nr:amphi-Trp domain-containing protein [Pseudomonadota bacterium]MBU1594181.1 amphi-Trp domain-containing protein [Pseudomonadota bacterium]